MTAICTHPLRTRLYRFKTPNGWGFATTGGEVGEWKLESSGWFCEEHGYQPDEAAADETA